MLYSGVIEDKDTRFSKLKNSQLKLTELPIMRVILGAECNQNSQYMAMIQCAKEKILN